MKVHAYKHIAAAAFSISLLHSGQSQILELRELCERAAFPPGSDLRKRADARIHAGSNRSPCVPPRVHGMLYTYLHASEYGLLK